MSKNIKISPKHGVNPSICKCFFCGQDKGIVLLGKLKNDAEAPREIVMDYEPCDNCLAGMQQGVTLLEVSNVQPSDGRPSVKAQDGSEVYPLERMVVLKAEAVSRMFNMNMKAGQRIFVDSEIMDMFIPQQ